jgi:hypothetical protein
VINKTSSEYSATYSALLSMIEKAWLLMGPSELKEYLENLQRQGFITSAEHKSLFSLAMGKNKTDRSSTS